MIGLGTFRLQGDELHNSLTHAIKCGYRLIDTASVYHNEEEIGITLNELISSGMVKREELIVTSKLSPKDHGRQKAYDAAIKSLKLLNLDYLDYYLIHWPARRGWKPQDIRNADIRRDSWRALEQLHVEGKLRKIGICNYTVRHLTELLDYAKIKPALLQVEFHPLLWNDSETRKLMNICRDNGIIFQAYSSFGEGVFLRGGETDDDTESQIRHAISAIASRASTTPSQLLLAWSISRNVWVIPKSTTETHLRENFSAYNVKLSIETMAEVDSLCVRFGRRKFCWDPAVVL